MNCCLFFLFSFVLFFSFHNMFKIITPLFFSLSDEKSTPVLPSRLPMSLALGQQQQQQLAQAATMEHFRERLERGAGGAAAEGPEKKMMRMAEEQQRFMQQALQQNLLAFASHFNPVNLKLNNGHGELPSLG